MKKPDRTIPIEFQTIISELPEMDIRIGQFLTNFTEYIKVVYDKDDIFYIENNDLVIYMKEYLDYIKESLNK